MNILLLNIYDFIPLENQDMQLQTVNFQPTMIIPNYATLLDTFQGGLNSLLE